MTRARELAKLANPEVFSVDSSNNVGVNSLTPDAKLDVIGLVSATSFSGDGSQLTGIIAGSTLSASNGTQRLVVTSQTTGTMTQAATNSDITYDTGTSVLSATKFSGTLLGNSTGLQGTPSITVQDITAEQISIAGTISYEDVSNVNSVGIITANKGIQVPDYGVVVTGVVTATSYQGDGSQLTGIEAGSASFVATGTIPNGSPVVINTDGTVSVAATTSVGQTISSEVVFGASGSSDNRPPKYISSIYDSINGKVIIVYADDSYNDYGTAIVGTVSGNSISFGSAVTFNRGQTVYPSSAYDSTNGKVVIAYRDDSNSAYGKAIVGTVSGNSIIFGSEVIFSTASTNFMSCTHNSYRNAVVIAYQDNNNNGKAIVGTISGTSIVFGAAATFSGQTNEVTSTYDSTNGKVVIVYSDYTGGKGTAIIGNVTNSNSINFGSAVVFDTGNTTQISSVYDSTNEKVVIAYRDESNSSYGTAIVGTISGTSISFGSEVVFNSQSVFYMSSSYDSTNGKVVITYQDGGNSDYGTAIVGTVSGTSITFGSEVVFNAGDTNYTSSVSDPNGKVVIAYGVGGGGDRNGRSVVFNSNTINSNLTAENYIGIAAEAISNGATGKITVVSGTNSSQTGLTTAQTYYVQGNGTFATSPDSSGYPSVVAGTSISSTKILVR